MNSSEFEATLPTALDETRVIGTDTVTAAVSHIVSVMEYLVHRPTVATIA